MTVELVASGLRAWLRVLPPSAPLTIELAVSALAPHLSEDAAATVEAMEDAGVALRRVTPECPICEGVDGFHSWPHEPVDLVEETVFAVLPEALPAWLMTRLRNLQVLALVQGT